MATIQVGDAAPDFHATDSDGQSVGLSEFKGRQAVVLFFYPSDNTRVCTEEACAFRDAYSDLTDLGAAVIGISGNSAESHRGFADQHRLPYRLIADSDGAMRKAFGVANIMFVVPRRVTFVIDKSGIVRGVYNSLFEGTRHVEQAVATLKELKQQQQQQ